MAKKIRLISKKKFSVLSLYSIVVEYQWKNKSIFSDLTFILEVNLIQRTI
jgi:hypothetical protein